MAPAILPRSFLKISWTIFFIIIIVVVVIIIIAIVIVIIIITITIIQCEDNHVAMTCH